MFENSDAATRECIGWNGNEGGYCPGKFNSNAMYHREMMQHTLESGGGTKWVICLIQKLPMLTPQTRGLDRLRHSCMWLSKPPTRLCSFAPEHHHDCYITFPGPPEWKKEKAASDEFAHKNA
ncbi:hypothetical protein DFH08DRAFT_798933 [Mycena albidolilacea]|uniref:Uncharacterized protein n=1 Tax=Mycena albidolilacea TaxID=1033008 RepID=A0AAD7AQ11_9AGAR|nr:hypothetical protein DFH08DRAFT_798933 [Mycena albidolilacea]